ncbi:hypothetical protein FA118_28910 [Pseudomonas aeruginosa]|nr:hypothetical protein [Pseudomonas aeruginosa]
MRPEPTTTPATLSRRFSVAPMMDWISNSTKTAIYQGCIVLKEYGLPLFYHPLLLFLTLPFT